MFFLIWIKRHDNRRMSNDNVTTQNADAALCRSTGKLGTVMTDLSKCTTTTETSRTQTLGTKLTNITSDIQYLKSNITDTFITGDAIFGQYGSVDIAKNVQQSNAELEDKKRSIEKEIANNEAVIERANRDFSDVKNTLPEKPTYSRLHFIEDYTVFFLVTSYLFMVLLCGYLYVMASDDTWSAVGQVTIASVFGTLFLGILFYYLA